MLKFNVNTTKYNEENAFALAHASLFAYEDSGECRRLVSKHLGMTSFRFFNIDKLCQGFVAADNEKVFIVFRGTDQFRDWLKNVKAILTAFQTKQQGTRWGNIHLGFSEVLAPQWGGMARFARNILADGRIAPGKLMAQSSTTRVNTATGHAGKSRLDMAKEIRDVMREKIREKSGRTVWFTGHSLGGAWATLAAADWVANHRETVAGIYTFGQPRVGDDDFADRYDRTLGDRHFRFVNDIDIVPRVPTMGLGYAHVGQLRYITNDTPPTIETDRIWWQRALDVFEGVMEDIGELLSERDVMPEFITDHKMPEGYLKRIGLALGKTPEYMGQAGLS